MYATLALAAQDPRMVSHTFASWNRIRQWLAQADAIRTAA